MPGVEMHANAYETLARQMFLVDAPLRSVVAATFAFAAAASLSYALASGWIANLGTLLILMAAQILPIVAFAHSVIWPWMPSTSAVILATASAAAWRHLIVRRELIRAENEKIPLSADHALRYARDAHAAHRNSGLERNDRPLQFHA